MPITITPEVEAIVREFDQTIGPLDRTALLLRLGQERQAMDARRATSAEDFGMWCELVPLYVQAGPHKERPNPWHSYFRPFATMAGARGETVILPEIENANVEALDHWRMRARTLRHPVLKARYADVVWELGRLVPGAGEHDAQAAQIAIRSYLAAARGRLGGSGHADLTSAQRAEQLALETSDWASIKQAKFIERGLRGSTFLPRVARGARKRSHTVQATSIEA